MKKSRLISVLIFVMLTAGFAFAQQNISIADSDNGSDYRLYDEEIYSNQEIYITEQYAVSTFYNYNIKKYDEISDSVIDVRNGETIQTVSFPLDYIDLFLYKNDGYNLVFDSCLLEQYFGLTVRRATLDIQDGLHSISIDLTLSFNRLLSCDNVHYSIGGKVEVPLDEILYIKQPNYLLELKLETYLPNRSNAVSSGYYFIYPHAAVDQFAFDANSISSYQVFLWNFGGSNTQVWQINVSSLNEYVTIKNVYNGLYLKWDLQNMDVLLDTGNIIGNRFVIEASGSSMVIKPWFYTEKIVRYGTLSNYSNIYLTNTPAVIQDIEKWDFVPVTPLGAASTYREINSSTIKCYPYAMRKNLEMYVTVPNNNPNYSVTDIAGYVCADPQLDNLGIFVRQLEGTLSYSSYVKTNEYRVAVRVGYSPVVGRDYHFMEQLSDGSWAHKQGEFNSKNDITDPETDHWNYYVTDNSFFENFYNSSTVFLAVSSS